MCSETIIKTVQRMEGVGGIFTVSGLAGGVRGLFNAADGLLTADGLSLKAETCYLIVDIGQRPELPLGINEVNGEGQDE